MILAFRRLRQGDSCECEASLGYRVSLKMKEGRERRRRKEQGRGKNPGSRRGEGIERHGGSSGFLSPYRRFPGLTTNHIISATVCLGQYVCTSCLSDRSHYFTYIKDVEPILVQ